MCKFIYDRAAVGVRIQEKRKNLHITQERLAEMVDKSLRLIAEVERGAAGMSIETMLQVCKALKTTPNDLLLPQENASSNELEWMTAALKSCSAHDRATAIDLVRTYLKSL